MDHMVMQANSIIHHQRILSQIKSEIQQNLGHPFEQDYIYRKHFGHFPAEKSIIEVNGVRITTQVLHQTGRRLSDISGADLLYEIENEKFALIQYKLECGNTVTIDRVQLEKMLLLCPDACYHKRREPNWSPLKLNGFCGFYFAIVINGLPKYLHACEIKMLFREKNTIPSTSFVNGLKEETFDELFASCRIGALTRIDSSRFVNTSIDQGNLVLSVQQEGKW